MAKDLPDARADARWHAPALWVLLGLFCSRVLGQMLVAFFGVSFLPSMEEWFSGTIPYRWLLLSQILIIFIYGKVCLDFTFGRGFFVIPRRSLGTGLLKFGSFYLGVMVMRYVIRMSLYPHERWTGGSIPIFFHWVLASFLLLVGYYHWERTRGEPRPVRGLVCRAASFLVGALVTVGILAWLAYQLAPWFLGRRLGIGPPEFAVRVERSMAFTTSNGVRLVADVYRPRRAGVTPTLLMRIPLSKTLQNTLFVGVVGRMWAEHGYKVVFQGTRGRYESGGQYDPLRHERQDGLETLEWLERQPWFDGRLGMWGGSYFAYTQWVLADQVNPGPQALFIQLASTDFHGMFYPGGAFSLESTLFWALRSHGPRDVWPSPEALERGFNGFPLIEADDRAGKDIPFFDDWVSHPERDPYWVEIDGEDRNKTLKAPVLLMAGWFDPFLPTQLNDFVCIRSDAEPHVARETRLIVGPWAHAHTVTFPGDFTPRNYRLESLAPSVAWFDRHLKFSGQQGTDFPAVRIYVMGENVWRDEPEWPLARTQYTAYYLRGRGRANTAAGSGILTLVPPDLSEAPDSYVYDPRNPVPTAGGAMLGFRAGVARQNSIEARSDVLVYTGEPLEEDLEVTGPIQLVLYVSTTAPSTDFAAKLVDVRPDGSAYNVSDGILRHGFGPSERKRPTEIHIQLWPTSTVIFKGHRVRLEVSSSNYPRFDRNPNTGRPIATETEPVPATQTVYHGPRTPSRVILPVIPRAKRAAA